jgi:glycosyltransferase involved in cell wall biosynthesis
VRAVIVPDLEDWVLGDIARRLKEFHADSIDITVLPADHPDFHRALEREQHRADVVHVLSPWVFLRHSQRIGRPCVVTIAHLVDESWSLVLPHANRMDAVSAMSSAWRDRLETRLPPGLETRHTRFGLDTTRFQPDRDARQRFLSEAGLEPDTVILGYAGSSWSNESGRKGLDRVWPMLSRFSTTTVRPLVFRLVGRGWRREMVPADIRHLVRLEGMLPGAAMPTYFSSLDAYLCTSRVEGGPYPVLEAMSCGTVVLTTAVGQVPEMLEDRVNGFLLGHETVVEDGVAVLTLLDSDPRIGASMGAAARHTMTRLFDWHRVLPALDLTALYRTAMIHFRNRPLSERAVIGIRAELHRAAGRWAPSRLRRAAGRLMKR